MAQAELISPTSKPPLEGESQTLSAINFSIGSGTIYTRFDNNFRIPRVVRWTNIDDHILTRAAAVSRGAKSIERPLDTALRTRNLEGFFDKVTRGDLLPEKRLSHRLDDRKPFREASYAAFELSTTGESDVYKLETAISNGGAIAIFNSEGRVRDIITSNVDTAMQAANRDGVNGRTQLIHLREGETLLAVSNAHLLQEDRQGVESLLGQSSSLQEFLDGLQKYGDAKLRSGISGESFVAFQLPKTRHSVEGTTENYWSIRRKLFHAA